jgi:hypothetical protein
MGETAGEIEQDIEAHRAALQADIEELGARVKSAADWKNYYRNYTVAVLAAAFCGGMLLSGLVPGPPRGTL